MTQHIFQLTRETECMVGWDPPLSTFFGQVYLVDQAGERVEEQEDGTSGTLLWVGTSQAEIRTVDHLARCLAPYAKLPAKVHRKLYRIEID